MFRSKGMAKAGLAMVIFAASLAQFVLQTTFVLDTAHRFGRLGAVFVGCCPSFAAAWLAEPVTGTRVRTSLA
jgi:hypothetical protein